MEKKTIKYLELFAGIGGFRTAMDSLKKDIDFNSICVGFSEIDKYAIASYKANYDTSKELEMGDIVAFTESVKNIKRIPDFDILFGGFPCQPFSLMGSQLGTKDSRGSLFFSVIKILKVKKPKYILLENVRNLYLHDKGKTYMVFKKELEKNKYKVREDIFNTSDFGLPQHRRRLYIFATRDNLNNNQEFSSEVVKNHFNKLKKRSIKRHKNVLDNILDRGLVEEKYYLSEKIKPTILSNGSKNFKSRSEINQLIARPLTATMMKMHRACQDNYYSQEFLNSSNPEKYLSKSFLKEEEAKHRIRKITPCEALRLQGFSDKFYKNLKKTNISECQIYKQAGNAVSINSAYAVLDYLINCDLIK